MCPIVNETWVYSNFKQHPNIFRTGFVYDVTRILKWNFSNTEMKHLKVRNLAWCELFGRRRGVSCRDRRAYLRVVTAVLFSDSVPAEGVVVEAWVFHQCHPFLPARGHIGAIVLVQILPKEGWKCMWAKCECPEVTFFFFLGNSCMMKGSLNRLGRAHLSCNQSY